jgi:hypothetical protein
MRPNIGTQRAAYFQSSNHFVRPVQQRLRNCDANLLGSFEIDDELKLCRLLHREIGGA